MIGELEISAGSEGFLSQQKSPISVYADAHDARSVFRLAIGRKDPSFFHRNIAQFGHIASRIRFFRHPQAAELDRGECCRESLAFRGEH